MDLATQTAEVHAHLLDIPAAALQIPYVLTRPLGATLGDTFTKPVADRGLNLGRITTSFVIAAAMVMVAWTWRRERNRLTPQVTS